MNARCATRRRGAAQADGRLPESDPGGALTLQQHWRLKEETWSRQGAGPPLPSASPPSSVRHLRRRPDPRPTEPHATRRRHAAGASPLPDDPSGLGRRKRSSSCATFDRRPGCTSSCARPTGRARRGASVAGPGALVAQGRQHGRGLVTLTQVLAGRRYRGARDEQGRLVAPSALSWHSKGCPTGPPRGAQHHRAARGAAARLLRPDAAFEPETLFSGGSSLPQSRRSTPELLLAEEAGHGLRCRRRSPAGARAFSDEPAGCLVHTTAGTLSVVLLRETRIVADLESQLRRLTFSPDVRWRWRLSRRHQPSAAPEPAPR